MVVIPTNEEIVSAVFIIDEKIRYLYQEIEEIVNRKTQEKIEEEKIYIKKCRFLFWTWEERHDDWEVVIDIQILRKKQYKTPEVLKIKESISELRSERKLLIVNHPTSSQNE